MKKILSLLLIVSGLLSAQTQLTLNQINNIWAPGQVPKGANQTNTWYSLYNAWQVNGGLSGSGTIGFIPYYKTTSTFSISPLYTSTSGYIGLGTTSPSTNFHLVGGLRYVDGNQAATKILTSDANGNATWNTAPTTTVSISSVGSCTITSAGAGTFSPTFTVSVPSLITGTYTPSISSQVNCTVVPNDLAIQVIGPSINVYGAITISSGAGSASFDLTLPYTNNSQVVFFGQTAGQGPSFDEAFLVQSTTSTKFHFSGTMLESYTSIHFNIYFGYYTF